MAVENDDPSMYEANTSRSQEQETETEKEKKDSTLKESTEDEKEKAKTVPFLKLFSFADSADILLMIMGTIGAIGNGLGRPLMSLLMGEMVDAFGSNQGNKSMAEIVSKVKGN